MGHMLVQGSRLSGRDETRNDHAAMVTGNGTYTSQKKKILIIRCFADFQVFKEKNDMKLLL